jgi:uncharacterized RDD family membrane protein YckC
MGSALLDTATLDLSDPSSPDGLRMQVAERLAAHRDRRRRPRATAASPELSSSSSVLGSDGSATANARWARVAAAVAERYARSPSYRAFLAAEAEKALQQARAAAEVAALNMRAVAEAQRQLMDALGGPLSGGPLPEDAGGERGASASVLQRNADGDQVLSIYDEGVQEQLRELTLWPELGEESPSRPSVARRQAASRKAAPGGLQPNASTASSPSQIEGDAPLFAQAKPHAAAPAVGLTVRLYQDASAERSTAGPPAGRSPGGAQASSGAVRSKLHEDRSDPEALALDEEIAFRQSPVFEAPATPPVPLPANLIEFPRQLVASRKARPRYAEGPLRDEPDAVPGAGQLRIFEVDPAEISTTPAPAEAAAPQWTSIWLDAPGRAHAGAHAATDPPGQQQEAASAALSLRPAPIGRRVLAGAINGLLVLAGFVVFAAASVLVSVRLSGAQPAGPMHGLPGGGGLGQLAELASRTGVQPGAALAAGAIVAGLLYLVYQALFFWFSVATPGMRIARIALCTFTDENPTRAAMRRRVLAALLSACPLGLGFLWAVLDEDRLTWHDRVSRMYQRSY